MRDIEIRGHAVRDGIYDDVHNNSGYYTFLDLSSSPLFFPFEFTPDKADMMEDDRFIFSNFGGEITVGII